MKKNKTTYKINSEVSEKDLIESLLNAYNSGVSREIILFFMSIHALAKRWHYNKFSYYLKLIGFEDD